MTEQGHADLARSVEECFRLGPLTLEPMVGSSHRLWRGGDFVVKEFPYDPSLEGKRRAARFEYEVWQSGAVPMPEPIPARDGELIVRALGSRGRELGIRVHRWVDGAPALDPSPASAAEAGRLLRCIQDAGRHFAAAAPTNLRWWEGEAIGVSEDALALLADAERAHPTGTFTHCDHKPQNALVTRRGIAVLDWDECGHCSPRLEAVESALRWSVIAGAPDRERFRANLDGYGLAGTLEPVDFAKWVSALIGWTTFQTRRVRGEFAEDDATDREIARQLVDDAQRELATTMESLDEWSSWLG